jgi:hypothetical protein
MLLIMLRIMDNLKELHLYVIIALSQQNEHLIIKNQFIFLIIDIVIHQ